MTTFNKGRRQMLLTGLGATAAAGLAAPAIAQSNPSITWRMPTTFGRNLIALYGSAERFSAVVNEMTEGNFNIQWFGPGELVPPLGVADAVSEGTVEIGQTTGFYNVGQDPTWALATGLVFGMNVRGHAAWLVNGGGNELMQDFFTEQGVHALFTGNTGAQSAGWFRKEITSMDDFQGLRMRIAGLAGQVFAEAGGSPQQIAPGEIYTALERGTIDGTKFTSPIDDEQLGFARVAPNYYWPGWNDGGAAVHTFVNLGLWNDLPPHYQTILTAAASHAAEYMQTKYDAENPAALRRVLDAGAQIKFLPPDVINALSEASDTVYGRIASENARFKEIYDHYTAYRQDLYFWWRVSELPYDTMMVRKLFS
ncbi:TRAP transporter substrate-binding protein [Roseovarius sp. CH_XMU1461]|uniref:TRAP transporter substrate-binding protein n=1 Tax=Roseovarius sp. CH_XMU1461 TaxID=3107777 RepID=UPI003008FF92